jgi:UDP-2,3-diacylglucosamine hydrolase
MIVHEHEWNTLFHDKRFYIRHGDGLGPGNQKYNFYKKLMRSRSASLAYSLIHPRIGLGIMRRASRLSRENDKDDPSHVNDRAISFCEQCLNEEYVDYFVMGHSHHPAIIELSNMKSKYVNLGDWVSRFTYGVWDGREFKIAHFAQQ